MKDGFRVSLVGLIAAIALGLLLILSAKWYGEQYLGKKFDAYFLGLLGIIGACIGWLFRFAIKIMSKSLKEVEDKLSGKADKTYVEERMEMAKMYVDDHKENNESQFNMIHEFMTSIDNSLKDMNKHLLDMKKK